MPTKWSHCLRSEESQLQTSRKHTPLTVCVTSLFKPQWEWTARHVLKRARQWSGTLCPPKGVQCMRANPHQDQVKRHHFCSRCYWFTHLQWKRARGCAESKETKRVWVWHHSSAWGPWPGGGAAKLQDTALVVSTTLSALIEVSDIWRLFSCTGSAPAAL